MSDDDIEFEFEMNIVEWPNGLYVDLVEALKNQDVDIVKGSAFTGADVLALLGVLTEPVLNALTSVFQNWSTSNKDKKIVLQVGDNRIEMQGISKEDFVASKSKMLEIMKEMKRIDDSGAPS